MADSRITALLNASSRRVHLYVLDVTVAVSTTVVYIGFANAGSSGNHPGFQGPGWLGVLIALGVGLPLALRRRWPLAVLAVVLAASMTATLLRIMLEPYLAMAFVLYLVGLAEPLHRSIAGVAVSATGAATAILLTDSLSSSSTGTIAAVWLFSGASWVLGRAVRGGRTRAVNDAERRAQQAIIDERLRIARELHDVVAHSMSLIAVKAAVGNHVAPEHPEEAREALSVVETTTREALIEMRHLLGVLRSSRPLDSELTPSPRLDGLGELVDNAKMAGVRTELTVRGSEVLPESLGLSVYRIVQEALTNVVKHAAPTSCRVLVDVAESEARVDVTDDGPGRRILPQVTSGNGHGQIGMRERVLVYGGTFEAGPLPHGGYRVLATLPFQQAEASV